MEGSVHRIVDEKIETTMATRFNFSKLILLFTILHQIVIINSSSSSSVFVVVSAAPAGGGICEFSVVDRNKIYNYSLASPTPQFPHGVLSEDGFYKVAVNETVLWFQLCDEMIFNHDPPKCVGCLDCGGPSRCGMGCSALVSDYVGGYPVCNTIGHMANTGINVIDKKNPRKGVALKMSSIGVKHNCSLSVSVICDSNGVQGPHSLEKNGTCDYATELRHPLGCARIVAYQGNGMGWFGILITIMVCGFGVYLLAGAVYRFFILGVRGIDVIPNLEFWTAVPHRTQSFFVSSARKSRVSSESHYSSSYSPINS